MTAAVHASGARLGRIGPNAITRVAQALPPRVGSGCHMGAVRARRPAAPPAAAAERHGRRGRCAHPAPRNAGGAGRGPGQRCVARCRPGTGDYLLAHRIPPLAQRLLRSLPAFLAARLLLKAVQRNAWTFVGSGEFSASAVIGQPVVLRIRHNPLCQGLASSVPACDYYAMTFERLFQVLVHPQARVFEVACEACGDPECRFEVRW